jgi:hypothetical protein
MADIIVLAERRKARAAPEIDQAGLQAALHEAIERRINQLTSDALACMITLFAWLIVGIVIIDALRRFQP